MEPKFSLQTKNLNSECTKTQKIGFWWTVSVTFLALLYCFRDGISGNDFWWHVKAGEWIWENRMVPGSDIFSWYGMEKEIPWTAHEWLAEVLFYLIYRVLGTYGIYLLSFVFAVLFLVCMLAEGKKYAKNNLIISGLFLTILSVIISMFFYGRPQIFSFFFLFFELKWLYAYFGNPNSRKIYFLPVLACLWSNLHGGSSNMSYLLCVVFFAAGMCQFRIGKIVAVRWSKKSIVTLTGVTILTVLALLVNPIGWKVMEYPYRNLGDKLSMSMISEWAAPDAKSIGHLILFFLPIVLMLFGFLAEEAEIRLIDLLVMGLFVFLFLRSQRFIILWYIAAVFCAFRYMPEARIAEIKSKIEYLISGVTFAAVVAGNMICLFVACQNMQQGNSMVSELLSDEMLTFLSEERPQRLYNDYDYGGELIFHEIPVFWDGRADLYAAEHIMENASNLLYVRSNGRGTNASYIEELISYYNFDGFLIARERPLCEYLLSHPEKYRIAFSDDEAIFFKPIYSKK